MLTWKWLFSLREQTVTANPAACRWGTGHKTCWSHQISDSCKPSHSHPTTWPLSPMQTQYPYTVCHWWLKNLWLNTSEASCLHPSTPGSMPTSCFCQHWCCKGNSVALLLLLASVFSLSGFLKAGYVNLMYISLLRTLSLGVSYGVWWCWGA